MMRSGRRTWSRTTPLGVAAARPPKAVLEQGRRRSKTGLQDIRAGVPFLRGNWRLPWTSAGQLLQFMRVNGGGHMINAPGNLTPVFDILKARPFEPVLLIPLGLAGIGVL